LSGRNESWRHRKLFTAES